MAQETFNTQFNFQGFNTLKKDLREATQLYQQMLQAGTATTAQIEEQAKVVARLKDEIDDANDATAALTGAGKFQAFTRGLTAVSGGFQAIQGAIALAGGESEDFQKTMVKLQAAMALTQGLAALEDLGNAFRNMSKVAVGAFNAIKAAIGSTGIGLLVVALGSIVVYWDDIKETMFGVSAEQSNLNKKAAENLTIQKENLSLLEDQDNLLKLQGLSEKEIYEKKLDQYNLTVDAAKKEIEGLKVTYNLRVAASNYWKNTTYQLLRFIEDPIRLIYRLIDNVGNVLGKNWNLEKSFGKGLAEVFFNPKQIEDEGKKAVTASETYLKKLENQRAGLILTQREKEKAEADKARDDKKKRDVEAEKKRLEHEQKITEITREEILKRESLLTQELEKIDDSYEEKFKLAKGNEQLINQLLESLRAERLAKIEEFQQKEKDLEEKRKKEFEQRTEGEFKQALQYVDDYYTGRENLAKQDFIKGIITEEELARRLEQINKQRLQQRLQTAKDYGQETLDYEKELMDEILKLTRAAYDETEKRRNKLLDNIDEEYERKKRAAYSGLESDREFAKEERKLELEKLETQREVLMKLKADTEEVEYEIRRLKRETAEEEVRIRTEAANAVIAIGQASFQGLIDLDNIRLQNALNNDNISNAEKERLAKESFDRQKALYKAMAILDAAKAVTSIYAEYPKFDGGIMMFLALGLAAVQLGVAMAKINEAQYVSPVTGGGGGNSVNLGSKFAMGGMLIGPSHSQGGIKTSMGELEGGEFVVNRIASQAFLPILEQINSVGQSNSERMMMQSAPQPIIKTYVVATDMDSALEKKRKIEKLARL